jgi:hypothetical protein
MKPPSPTLEAALSEVRNWCDRHNKPTLTLSDVHFGMKCMFARSIVIVDAMTQNNSEPHIIHVRFACDDRRTTFPVTLDQLEPFSAVVADTSVIN